MNFDSPSYLVFAPVVVLVTWALARDSWRHGFLLAASYAFYGAWDYRFLALILFITAAAYVAAPLARGRHDQRWVLTLCLVVLLAPLAIFKYFDFFADGLTGLLNAVGLQADWATLNLILPVGISFYTFQTISYVLDVRSGRMPAEENFLKFALYVAFFPQLVAGPIVRAIDFLPQLHRPWQAPTSADVASHMTRFLWGFFKKAFIADRLAMSLVDPVFAQPDLASAPMALLAVFAFSLLIYADFSGYSDMAIGMAGLLGFRFRDNFLSPYWSPSIRVFWQRWHVSLSRWILDYLYIPLGGSRAGRTWRNYANLLIAMGLCGLWHGAAWTFVVWGLLHGLALAGERAFSLSRLLVPLGWLITTGIVLAGWLVFRAEGMDGAIAMANAVLGAHPQGVPPTKAMLLFVAVCGTILYTEQMVLSRLRDPNDTAYPRRIGGTHLHVGMSIALAATMLLAVEPDLGERSFIYFQF